MDAKTLEALKGSIEKWEGIVAGRDTDRGQANCSLCYLFNNPILDTSDFCEGCPIKEKSGIAYCNGTHYSAWLRHQKEQCHPFPYGINCSECSPLAQAELDFLKSLLPEETK